MNVGSEVEWKVTLNPMANGSYVFEVRIDTVEQDFTASVSIKGRIRNYRFY